MWARRGATLAMVVVIAFLCAVAAYVVLFVALSEARRGRLFRERAMARYAGEAALVIAMQKLWADPGYCGGTELIDTNGDSVGDAPVVVTVTACGVGNVHQLLTNVTF